MRPSCPPPIASQGPPPGGRRRPPKGIWALLLGLVAAAAGAQAPNPPCGQGEAWPAFAPAGSPPLVKAWSGDELQKLAWVPHDCTGWTPPGQSTLVVALAGSFRQEGSVEVLAGRIGAISSLKETFYWSRLEKAWRPVAADAAALAGSDSRSRRPDFQGAELLRDSLLHYWVRDPWTGPAVYRLRVLERTPMRLVVASENVTPVRFLFITLFQPGTLQALEFLERTEQGVWRVYLLARFEGDLVPWGWDREASAINRLVALYRRLAEIPTDQEPPAAP